MFFHIQIQQFMSISYYGPKVFCFVPAHHELRVPHMYEKNVTY